MMGLWDRLVWEIGYAICHQLPERTIFFGERGLPVCARDTGLFSGFFLVFLVVIFPWRKEQGGLPSNSLKVLVILALLFLTGDVLTTSLGWRQTNNFIRLTSGLLAGGGLALIAGPFFNRIAWGAPCEKRAIGKKVQLVLLALTMSSPLVLFLVHPQQLFRLAQVAVVLSILGTLLVLNLTLLLALVGRYRSCGNRRTGKHMALFVLVALFLVAGELLLANRLHAWLEGFSGDSTRAYLQGYFR